MTATTPTNVDSSIQEIWAKDVLRRQKIGAYWARFSGGEGSGSPIITKSELVGTAGDLIHIQVTDPLSGAGVQGDTAMLEGNEENLATSEIKAAPDLYRHGVRSYRRANKKSLLDLRNEAKLRLAEWGMAKMDAIRFANFLGTSLPAPLAGEVYNAPNKFFLAATDGVDGGTTVGDSATDITGTDLLTVKAIQTIKLKLKMQHAKPLNLGGREGYVGVVHPYSTFDLKQDTRYEAWARDAQTRGEGNPLFTGALLMIDGVVIHEHESVPVSAGGAAGIQVASNLFFGAEAFVEAQDEDVTWVERDFDYGNQFGVAYSFAFQPRRALELNSLQVWTAAVAK
jgi:N4-gp56 family major capsid protein